MKIRNSLHSFAIQVFALRQAQCDDRIGLDGIAAALTRHGMPFIFITGYGRENLPLSFLQAQALDKPVSERQLLQAITKLLSTTGSVAQLRR